MLALDPVEEHTSRKTNPFRKDVIANLHTLLWNYPCKAMCHGRMESKCFFNLRHARLVEETVCWLIRSLHKPEGMEVLVPQHS